MLRADLVAVAERKRTLNDVLELANIPRPMIRQQRVEGVRNHLRRRLRAGPPRTEMLVNEMVHQQGDIFPSIPQRRDCQTDHVEPVVKILSELARLHQAAQISLCGADEADIDADRFFPAYALELLLFDRPKELYLQLAGNVIHFIQEHRTAVGQLEPPGLLADRAGEGTLFVSEQLAFQHGRLQGGAAQLDQGLVAPATVLVDGFGGQFLARSALTADQDRPIAVGDRADLIG